MNYFHCHRNNEKSIRLTFVPNQSDKGGVISKFDRGDDMNVKAVVCKEEAEQGTEYTFLRCTSGTTVFAAELKSTNITLAN